MAELVVLVLLTLALVAAVYFLCTITPSRTAFADRLVALLAEPSAWEMDTVSKDSKVGIYTHRSGVRLEWDWDWNTVFMTHPGRYGPFGLAYARRLREALLRLVAAKMEAAGKGEAPAEPQAPPPPALPDLGTGSEAIAARYRRAD